MNKIWLYVAHIPAILLQLGVGIASIVGNKALKNDGRAMDRALLGATFIGFFGAVGNLAIFVQVLRLDKVKSANPNFARQPMMWVTGLVQAGFVIADIILAAELHMRQVSPLPAVGSVAAAASVLLAIAFILDVITVSFVARRVDRQQPYYMGGVPA